MTSSTDRGSSDQTRTYVRASSVVFLKTDEPFGGLSNMASGYPLHVQGARILTSEALYQACRFPHLPDVQRLIIEQKSPMAAKMKSKPHRKDSRPDWDRVRVKTMRWCLRVKLVQNWASFSELLLRTGDRPIVEESRQDDFWGAKPVDEHTLVGMNVLGRQLMELREAIKVGGRDAFGRVEPPGIPDLLLFGRPVETVSGRGAQTAEPVATQSKHWARTDAGRRVAAQPSLFNQPTVEEGRPPKYSPERSEHAGIRNLKPYPRMKDSGVPWLGEVPEHWEVASLRHLVSVKSGDAPPPDKDVLGSYPVFGANGLIGRCSRFNSKMRRVVVGRVGAAGAINVTPQEVWITDNVLIVDPSSDKILPEFLPRLLSAVDLPSLASQSAQPLITGGHVKARKGIVPPLQEQSAIVRFLDHVDRRIRRYIRAKQKLIALLHEQRQAIIRRTMTRGLDPNVQLKPSGVDWLGDVPEHWTLASVRHLILSITSGSRGWAEFYADEGELFIQSGNLGRSMDLVLQRVQRVQIPRGAEGQRTKIAKGDVLVCITGALTGNVAFVNEDLPPAYVNQHVALLRPDTRVIVPRFLGYALHSPYAQAQFGLTEYGGTKQGLGLDDVRCVLVVVPSREEQRDIVARLDLQCRHIADSIDHVQREIALLREFRTRLIADVVTGKLDVREAAAHLPEETGEPEPLDGTDALGADISGDPEAPDLDPTPEEAEA